MVLWHLVKKQEYGTFQCSKFFFSVAILAHVSWVDSLRSIAQRTTLADSWTSGPGTCVHTMKCSGTVGHHRVLHDPLEDGTSRSALVVAIRQDASLGSREALQRVFTLRQAGVKSLVLTPLGLLCQGDQWLQDKDEPEILPPHGGLPMVLTGKRFLLRWDEIAEDGDIQQHLNKIILPQMREDFTPEPVVLFSGRDVGKEEFHQMFGHLRMTTTDEELTLDLYLDAVSGAVFEPLFQLHDDEMPPVVAVWDSLVSQQFELHQPVQRFRAQILVRQKLTPLPGGKPEAPSVIKVRARQILLDLPIECVVPLGSLLRSVQRLSRADHEAERDFTIFEDLVGHPLSGKELFSAAWTEWLDEPDVSDRLAPVAMETFSIALSSAIRHARQGGQFIVGKTVSFCRTQSMRN